MADEKNVLDKMWASGVPVKHARFQGDVNNGEGTPQTEFNLASNKRDRRVEMRLVPQGLLCFHCDEFFMVPLPHIKQIGFA